MEDEPITFYSVINYVRENIIGLLMFIAVFIIIYCVDHINKFNTMLYSMPAGPIQMTTKKKNHKKH